MSTSRDIKRFGDVVKYIDRKRLEVRNSVSFFETLKDESLSKQQRMLFVPYMLFFSLGSPDIKTLMMRFEKPQNELTAIQKKINDFINEDNFHYNFYLGDLEKLGYHLDKFGTTSAVVRHVFSEEAIPTRRLVYAIGSYIDQKGDPLIGLTIPEIIEAGLFDLFTTVYQYIIKAEHGGSLEHLDYFGDTHIRLEKNHTVTSWFVPGHPEDDNVVNYVVPDETFNRIIQMIDDLMGKFADMYEAFDEIVKSNKDIQPSKFDIEGFPPIDTITSGED